MTVQTERKLNKKERLSLVSLAIEKNVRILDSITEETLRELASINDVSAHAFMEARGHLIQARGILQQFTQSGLSVVKNGLNA